MAADPTNLFAPQPSLSQVGEYISVSSQRDAEKADIEKERQEQLKGPAAQVSLGVKGCVQRAVGTFCARRYLRRGGQQQ